MPREGAYSPACGRGRAGHTPGSAGGGRAHTAPVPGLRSGAWDGIPDRGRERSRSPRPEPPATSSTCVSSPLEGRDFVPCDPQCQATVSGCPGSLGQGEDKTGSCQGRQEVGSCRGASMEGWHLSRLPPLSPQPPEAAVGSGRGKAGSGGRGSLPRWVLGARLAILPQPAPGLPPR